MNLDLRAVLVLQLLDLPGDITVDCDGCFPIEVDRPMRDNIFLRAIDPSAGFVFDLGPIAREDVIGLPAEEQIERVAHLLSHDVSQEVVEVADGPSTVFEAAAIVFLRSTRSLHNPIERDE